MKKYQWIMLALLGIILLWFLACGCSGYRNKVIYRDKYILISKGTAYREVGNWITECQLYCIRNKEMGWYEAISAVMDSVKVGDTLEFTVLQIVTKSCKEIPKQ